MMSTARIPARIRQQVQERAKGLCEYCRTPDNIATSSFHCEHIVPQKVGGWALIHSLRDFQRDTFLREGKQTFIAIDLDIGETELPL